MFFFQWLLRFSRWAVFPLLFSWCLESLVELLIDWSLLVQCSSFFELSCVWLFQVRALYRFFGIGWLLSDHAHQCPLVSLFLDFTISLTNSYGVWFHVLLYQILFHFSYLCLRIAVVRRRCDCSDLFPFFKIRNSLFCCRSTLFQLSYSWLRDCSSSERVWIPQPISIFR